MNLWCLLLVAGLGATSAPTPASIHGIIRSAETGQPLFLAEVRLVAEDLSQAQRTDSTIVGGEFHFEGLLPGTYFLSVTYAGRAPRVFELQVEAGSVTELDVVLSYRLYEVGAVVVSGSRRPEKILDAPARVQLITGEEVATRTVLTPLDHMQGRPAIDVARTGLNQGTVVVRGFNNVFSGATLTLVDHRITRLPSLRVNTFELIPTSHDDIKQVEIVSGPGSALYGPNTANGVIHIRTVSPLDSAGTSVTVGAGNRGVGMGSMWHSQNWGDRVGVKITGQYHQGQDFEFNDPAEQFPRDFDNRRVSLEGRLDVRKTPSTSLAFSGGWNQIDAIELTPLGASQAKDLSYGYAQARMTSGPWFAQTYLTANDAGESFNLRTGEKFVDTSKLLVAEVQRTWTPHDMLAVITGFDLSLTRPETDGTIDGRNEDDDNIDQIGGYVHIETQLADSWSAVLALRIDGNNRLRDPVFSPRAGLMYQPSPGQRIRVTYNRAFSTPTSTNLFLDLLAGEDIFADAGLSGYDLWAKGVPAQGFQFRRDSFGGIDGLYMQVPSALGGSDVHIPADATLMWPFLQQAVPPLGTVSAPTSSEVSTVLATIDPNTGTFDPTDPGEVRDITRLQPTITNTIEAGYTASFADRFAVTADLYHSRIENFVGPLRIETPNVFMEEATLRTYLENNGMNPAQAAAIAGQVAGIPLGTVTPEDNIDPGDLMLTYRNFGRVDLTGVDLSTQFRVNRGLTLLLDYSYVSNDFFEDVEGDIDVALNAPKHKAGAGLEYRLPRYGVGAGVRVRYVDDFPVESGVYSGHIDAYTLADLTASYQVAPGARFGLTVLNALDNKHQEFVGAPELGRTAMLTLTLTGF